jgi:hypothetical protein
LSSSKADYFEIKIGAFWGLFIRVVKKIRKGGLETLRELYQAGKDGDWRLL